MLLAVVILGLSLTVFFGAANQGLFVVSEARQYEISRTLMHRLSLVEPIDLEDLEEGVDSGGFRSKEHGNVDWTREVSIEGREEDGFFRIRTSIEWGDRGNRRRESIETFLHRPSAMQGGWVREPAE